MIAREALPGKLVMRFGSCFLKDRVSLASIVSLLPTIRAGGTRSIFNPAAVRNIGIDERENRWTPGYGFSKFDGLGGSPVIFPRH